MKANTNTGNLNALLMSAFSLALCVLCLLMFRGPISISSSLLIPAIIIVFSKNNGFSYYLLVSSGLMIVVLLFFQAQTVFVVGYLLLSAALRILLINPRMELSLKPVPVLVYILIAAAVLYLGIRLTEWIFKVPLHRMMLSLSANNDLRYAAILLAEGFLVFLLNAVILKVFLSRIKAIKR